MSTNARKQLVLPKGKIGPQFTRKILPWVELYWHQHKRYPSDTALAAQFGLNSEGLMRLHASKFYLECLKARGITPNPEANLSEKQVAAIALITNFTDNRPVDAKLAAIGVTSEMYNGWMQNPNFKRELQSRADDILDNVYPEAQAMLAKQVRNGNFQALKFYFEITGRANSPEAINLKMTLVKMVEAVQKHVKDPAVLEAIGRELQSVGAFPVAEVPTSPIPGTVMPSMKQLHAAHLEGLKNE